MMNMETRAKLVLSFREEEWDHLSQLREQKLVAAAQRPSRHARLLRASGGFLIAAGNSLQHLAGMSVPVNSDRRQVGEPC